jgi:hypothetical protein
MQLLLLVCVQSICYMSVEIYYSKTMFLGLRQIYYSVLIKREAETLLF